MMHTINWILLVSVISILVWFIFEASKKKHRGRSSPVLMISLTIGTLCLIIRNLVNNEGSDLLFIILFGIGITSFTIGSIQLFVSLIDESY